MDLVPGTVVDRYVVEHLLGRGALATVYAVRHRLLDTSHALKVPIPGPPELQGRLMEEGRIQARLRHPNVVAVTDVLYVDGQPALLMDLVQGPNLESWLGSGVPRLDVIETIFGGILDGVDRAHALGIVHRDLKPANVLLELDGDRQVARVSDFGIAKALQDSGRLVKTSGGLCLGTPLYMAPEQILDPENIDARADIFALGGILYRMLCGRNAFGGRTEYEIFTAILEGRFGDPQQHNRELPERFLSAIRGALVVDRGCRIQDCASFKAMLGLASAPSIRAAPAAPSIPERPACTLVPPSPFLQARALPEPPVAVEAGAPEEVEKTEGTNGIKDSAGSGTLEPAPVPAGRSWFTIAVACLLLAGLGLAGILWLHEPAAPVARAPSLPEPQSPVTAFPEPPEPPPSATPQPEPAEPLPRETPRRKTPPPDVKTEVVEPVLVSLLFTADPMDGVLSVDGRRYPVGSRIDVPVGRHIFAYTNKGVEVTCDVKVLEGTKKIKFEAGKTGCTLK